MQITTYESQKANPSWFPIVTEEILAVYEEAVLTKKTSKLALVVSLFAKTVYYF
jgi:hypothetical protein